MLRVSNLFIQSLVSIKQHLINIPPDIMILKALAKELPGVFATLSAMTDNAGTLKTHSQTGGKGDA